MDGGGFTPAARTTGLTRSAVGKAISRLEARLGTRLLHRTTRRLSTTTDGEAFHDRCTRILADLAEAEASVGRHHAAPSGVLRLSLPDAYGRARILPLLVDFLARWPQVDARVGFTDRTVDVIEEGLDLAVRIGGTTTSPGLVTRVVDRIRGMPCASPTYLSARGMPADPAAFADHDWLVFEGSAPGILGTPKALGRDVGGRARASFDSAEAIRVAAVAGLGIAHLPRFLIADDLAEGRLISLPGQRFTEAAVHVIYPARRHLPARARLFIDTLVERLGERAISASGA